MPAPSTGSPWAIAAPRLIIRIGDTQAPTTKAEIRPNTKVEIDAERDDTLVLLSLV